MPNEVAIIVTGDILSSANFFQKRMFWLCLHFNKIHDCVGKASLELQRLILVKSRYIDWLGLFSILPPTLNYFVVDS